MSSDRPSQRTEQGGNSVFGGLITVAVVGAGIGALGFPFYSIVAITLGVIGVLIQEGRGND